MLNDVKFTFIKHQVSVGEKCVDDEECLDDFSHCVGQPNNKTCQCFDFYYFDGKNCTCDPWYYFEIMDYYLNDIIIIMVALTAGLCLLTVVLSISLYCKIR